MKIIAKSIKGAEYFYDVRTAHKVPQKYAEKIADALNGIGYKLNEKQVWYVHDVGSYDDAFYYAEGQRFTYGKTGIKRIGY